MGKCSRLAPQSGRFCRRDYWRQTGLVGERDRCRPAVWISGHGNLPELPLGGLPGQKPESPEGITGSSRLHSLDCFSSPLVPGHLPRNFGRVLDDRYAEPWQHLDSVRATRKKTAAKRPAHKLKKNAVSPTGCRTSASIDVVCRKPLRRRARDSNPQLLAQRLISNQLPNHSVTLQNQRNASLLWKTIW